MKPGLALLLVLPVAMVAQTVNSQPAGRKTLKILSLSEIDPCKLLPPPAPDGSDSQEQEGAALKHLLKARTPERFAQAQWDNAHYRK